MFTGAHPPPLFPSGLGVHALVIEGPDPEEEVGSEVRFQSEDRKKKKKPTESRRSCDEETVGYQWSSTDNWCRVWNTGHLVPTVSLRVMVLFIVSF